MEQLTKLGKLLNLKVNRKIDLQFNRTLLLFEVEKGLLLPHDLSEYFKLLGNTTNKLDANLYQFYAFAQFDSIQSALVHWEGIPNYKNIVNTFDDFQNCFVFADYMFHMFTYAIRLHQKATDINEIYILCGDKYKVIANSFSGFLDLYFDNSIDLQFT